MKKISHLSTFSSIIVLAFIVPQVAFAAWWNPLSWNIFRGADTKTQILETTSNELGSKVGNNASSTVSESKENAQKLTNEAPKVSNASWWNPFSWDIFRKPNTQTQQLEDKVKELEKKLEDKTAITTSEKSKPATPPKTQLAPQTKVEPRPAVPIPVQPPVVPDQVQQPVVSIPTTPVVEKDQYGMTASDWAREVKSIPLVEAKIASNENFINGDEERIASLNDSIRVVSEALASQGFLDSTARRYAQDYLTAAQEIKSGYGQEIKRAKDENDLLRLVIAAVRNQDKTSMDNNLATLKSGNQSFTDLIKADASLYSKQFDVFQIYANYVTTGNQSSYSVPTYAPTYAPTYTPPIQQYNTNCSVGSYGGTVNCTTYSPSSAAISACAYIKDKPITQASIDAAYAKCLQDYSQ